MPDAPVLAIARPSCSAFSIVAGGSAGFRPAFPNKVALQNRVGVEIVYGMAATFPSCSTALRTGCDMPAVALRHSAAEGMSWTGVTGSVP